MFHEHFWSKLELKQSPLHVNVLAGYFRDLVLRATPLAQIRKHSRTIRSHVWWYTASCTGIWFWQSPTPLKDSLRCTDPRGAVVVNNRLLQLRPTTLLQVWARVMYLETTCGLSMLAIHLESGSWILFFSPIFKPEKAVFTAKSMKGHEISRRQRF